MRLRIQPDQYPAAFFYFCFVLMIKTMPIKPIIIPAIDAVKARKFKKRVDSMIFKIIRKGMTIPRVMSTKPNRMICQGAQERIIGRANRQPSDRAPV